MGEHEFDSTFKLSDLNFTWTGWNPIEITTKTRPTIKQVIFNDPATIILWHDGTKTVVKCCDGDEYDAETGFYAAYLKKLLGDKQFNKDRHKWVKDEKPYKTKPPFNVGDKVKIINHRNWWWNIEGEMDKYMNKVLTIGECECESYTMKECPTWAWAVEDFVQD
jgi:hypothetical protein